MPVNASSQWSHAFIQHISWIIQKQIAKELFSSFSHLISLNIPSTPESFDSPVTAVSISEPRSVERIYDKLFQVGRFGGRFDEHIISVADGAY